MKNVIKKISAAAMAFTLLGAGTVITNTIAPQASNTLTASAVYRGSHLSPDGRYIICFEAEGDSIRIVAVYPR